MCIFDTINALAVLQFSSRIVVLLKLEIALQMPLLISVRLTTARALLLILLNLVSTTWQSFFLLTTEAVELLFIRAIAELLSAGKLVMRATAFRT